MSYHLTQSAILSMCGQLSYKKGESAFRSRKVAITYYDPDAARCEATVKLQETFEVSIRFDDDGDVAAKCSCPSLSSYDKYCSHVASVLLLLYDAQQSGRAPMGGGSQTGQTGHAGSGPTSASHESSGELARELLSMFAPANSRKSIRSAQTRFDTREPLAVTFVCKPFTYSGGKLLLGIELKVGSKRPIIVQQVREFLRHVELGEPFAIAKSFHYDPQLHSFLPEDFEVIRQLIAVLQQERLYQETSSIYAIHAAPLSGQRMLPIPPGAWKPLLATLVSAPSTMLEQGNTTYPTIAISEERIPPLTFDLQQLHASSAPIGNDRGSYHVQAQGLDQLVIIEAYGLVLAEGRFIELQQAACRRLAELQQLQERSSMPYIPILPEQIEPFMERVVPELLKLGTVHIAEDVSRRITHRPLKAKLFLDRIRDRLLAALEFHYGDLIINPLEAESEVRTNGPILVRDGEHERQILTLMEEASFAKTEAGYFLGDEDSEYHFLYHVVPQLEKLLTVHATSAVRTRIHTGSMPPIVKVQFNERTNWLDFKFDIDGIPEAEIRKLLKSIEEKRKFHRLATGALMPLETEAMQEIIRMINEARFTLKDLRDSGISIPLFRGLHLMDTPRQGSSVKLAKPLRQLLENLRNPDNLDFELPEGMSGVLRDYQSYGYQWMRTLARYGFGGILADDMGLGKTVQAIAFLQSFLPDIREERLPALIVAPASITYNWRNELRKFAPSLRVAIVDGTKQERDAILRRSSTVDVLITSYPLLRRDIEAYAAMSFHTLILDEAQAFKNYNTQTAQSVKLLKARHHFALTGTPVENRLEDLWSIFDAVCPELFPARRAFGDLPREVVAKRSRPFLLRRVKTDVLQELPEKIESTQVSKLLPEQKKLYAAYLAKLREETLKHLNKDTLHKNRIRILAGLTRLRQLCCHPALFIEDYAGSSAKLEQLLELIDECREAGKRLLVFSQFVEMLKIIKLEMQRREIPHFYLDGSTPSSERAELSTRFNDGERDLFLISLKAGGTGLNLTGADTVILYDLWWNPAVEQQAADRAHRIGQKKVVQVIRLVSEGTVEDKMYELQQRKKNLIDEVIQPGQEALSALTAEEIQELLMVEG
ncbi:DEAD/DEAH box helicase [Paenibacillus sp. CF384]|uniref:DEAD/DEAH box helicase n=1 Tax=Paenibacillus sp. CF384 TaxID=1884382 RepID=UPI000896C176|nr:DEAD/DEAH box helicase [Paenibacillus sp. CF384]SDX33168.1 Superfamily II DNA or RNA helicase, SNF2 family [Paenibacillus sp. CF384]